MIHRGITTRASVVATNNLLNYSLTHSLDGSESRGSLHVSQLEQVTRRKGHLTTPHGVTGRESVPDDLGLRTETYYRRVLVDSDFFVTTNLKKR